MFRFLLWVAGLAGLLLMLGGAAGAAPATPPPASATSIVTHWAIIDGSPVLVFPVSADDPALIAMLTAAAAGDPGPDVRWWYDPDQGINQVGFKLDPAPLPTDR